MTVLENNIEKLLILTSGIADKNKFNKKIYQIRKNHGIPKYGFPEINNYKGYKKWKTKNKQKKLQNDVTDIVKNHPDLHPDMISLIYNHVLFPNSIVGQKNGYKLSTTTIDGTKTCKLEFSNYMEPKELKNAIAGIKQMNQSMPHFRPLNDIRRDIAILKLSRKKGKVVKSNMPNLEDNYRFSDESIVSAVVSEEIDTIDNLKKNRENVRKRRSLAEKRIKELFPNTYKNCESK